MKKLLALQRTDLQKISATLLIMLQRNEYMFRRKKFDEWSIAHFIWRKKEKKTKRENKQKKHKYT